MLHMKLPKLAPLILAVSFAQAQPALTVYNENFGVVRDSLTLQLESGMNAVSYSGVTAQLEPESVILRDPTGKVALSVVEQSYRGDPVDQRRLLQMFEGQSINFLQSFDGKEVIVAGKIIRAPSVMKLQNQYGHEQVKTLEPIVEVEGQLQMRLPGLPLFPELGDDSVLQPTLNWKLFADQQADFEAQLSYLTRGLSWKADYNLVLPEQGDVVTLTGWVSIENNTGKSFDSAKIKLIAGDVNKLDEGQPRQMMDYAMGEMRAAKAAPQVEAKKFDEFHMYALPLPTTLRDAETKQVEFVRAEGVQTQKRYVYDGAALPYNWRNYGAVNQDQRFGAQAKMDVAIYREFENTEVNGLGVALPAGRTRFYRMDDDGQLEFTGENRIDHTPKDETIRVYLGNAFDLVGERKQSAFYRHPSRDLIRETVEIELRNRGEAAVTIQVIEHLYRWANWEIQSSSHAFEKTDAQTVDFPVVVASGATETVTYMVEYTW